MISSGAAGPDTWHERSWISSAYQPDQGFTLWCMPYCAFHAADGSTHLGVGIGDHVFDLASAAQSGILAFDGESLKKACSAAYLNELMECGPAQWQALRTELFAAFREDASTELQQALRPLLYPANSLRYALPVLITDYTDFYASREHATNVGKLFRPDQPLLPNYEWIPIGYHGRASSVVVSGTDVRRPRGQQLKSAAQPVFDATAQMDYEIELAAWVGVGSELGKPVNIANAHKHVFGYSLLNDWSARDIQAWEYQPLGPFLGKNFATSVSPWVVPAAALEPYRVSPRSRGADEAHPLPYLTEAPGAKSALDVDLEVWLTTEQMRAAGEQPFRISRGNAKDLYWSFAQMLTHHTSNGCNLRAGNLIASGTVSGFQTGSEGCLLERTRRGSDPITLPNGEVRIFLKDGDEIILRGHCERDSLPRISFGECRGRVLPAF